MIKFFGGVLFMYCIGYFETIFLIKYWRYRANKTQSKRRMIFLTALAGAGARADPAPGEGGVLCHFSLPSFQGWGWEPQSCKNNCHKRCMSANDPPRVGGVKDNRQINS